MRAANPIVLVLVVVLGCGSKTELGQVTGTVRAGGQPLANVLVTFVPQADGPAAGMRSMGTTDEQGRYQLKTERHEPGVLVGLHKVIVEDLAIYQTPRSSDGTVLAMPPARFSQAYSDPLRSPLAREVKAGDQTIDLDLEAAP